MIDMPRVAEVPSIYSFGDKPQQQSSTNRNHKLVHPGEAVCWYFFVGVLTQETKPRKVMP